MKKIAHCARTGTEWTIVEAPPFYRGSGDQEGRSTLGEVWMLRPDPVLRGQPHLAQRPARQDCEANVRILEMLPVAGGDPSLANYAWDNYVAFCEHPPWNKVVGADIVQEVAKPCIPICSNENCRAADIN